MPRPRIREDVLATATFLFGTAEGNYRRTWAWATFILVPLFFVGGQILFLLALVAVFLVTRPLLKRLLSAQDHEVHWTWITTPSSYVIGGLASYWLIDRISGFWL